MHLFPASLLAALLFSPVAFAQSPVSNAERRMIEDLSLEEYTVGYKDAKGNRIDFESFNKAVQAGSKFGHFKHTGTRLAMLVLEDETDETGHPHPVAPRGTATKMFDVPMPSVPGIVRADGERNEESLVESLGLAGYAVRYTDADGSAIDFAWFSAGMAKGREFSTTKNAKEKTAVLVLGLTNATSSAPAPAMHSGKPELLPNFSLRSLDGPIIDNATLISRPTLLSFHFAECLPCIREIPMLNAFARKNLHMNVFSVTFDDIATATAFRDKHGLEWPILPDAQSFIDNVGIKIYPTMVLVDASGTIRASESGVERLATEAQLQAWVDEALVSPAVP